MDPVFKQWCEIRNVSCETVNLLNQYLEVLYKWNNNINLMSKAALEDVWLRHVLDSASLLDYLDAPVVDLGSGAGFPGIILAIFNVPDITLVEANRKKAIFLDYVIHELKLSTKVKIINDRAENLKLNTNTVVSRACAQVEKILELVQGWHYRKILLLKSHNYLTEIAEAKKSWSFSSKIYPGANANFFILSLQSIKKCYA